MNATYITALNDIAEADRLIEKAAAALNCKPSDVKQTIAAAAYAEGANVVTGRDKLNQARLYTVTKPGSEKLSDDGAAACERLRLLGESVPQKLVKGSRSTLRGR